MNVVVLRGVLSSAPVVRELASGSVLHSLEVTTRDTEGNASSVPVVWVDPRRPPSLDAGDDVAVLGVVRRRFYRSGASVQSRTEVLADRVVAVRRAGDVERVLRLAATRLAV